MAEFISIDPGAISRAITYFESLHRSIERRGGTANINETIALRALRIMKLGNERKIG